MVSVDKSDIEKFFTDFLALPIFDEMQNKEDFKNFLVKTVYSLYDEYTSDVTLLFNKISTVTRISSAYAQNFGILKNDVYTVLKYIIYDIARLLTYKGSIDDLIYLKSILKLFGLSVKLYRIEAREGETVYYGYEIESNEKIVIDRELLSNKHLLYINDYTNKIADHNYKTIVIHLSVTLEHSFTDTISIPPAVLQAYAFTKFGNEYIYFYLKDNVYTETVVDFFKIQKYLVLKLAQLQNSNFDINVDPSQTYWNLRRDEDQLDEMYDLCDTYFNNINTREDFYNFVRAESLFLNQLTVTVGGSTVQDYSDRIHQINPDVWEEIEAMTEEELHKSILNMYNSMNIFAEENIALYSSDTVDSAAFKVFQYIAGLNVSQSETLTNQIDDIIYTFVKYFLPIYTDFDTSLKEIFKIYGPDFKLWVSDRYALEVQMKYKGSMIDTLDEVKPEYGIKPEGYIETQDYNRVTIVNNVTEERARTEDEWEFTIYNPDGSVKETVTGAS